jgi:Ca-activated chloride channel family protein
MTTAVTDGGLAFDQASADFRFAASVAEFGMILRGSPYKADATLTDVIAQAERAMGKDKHGYRAEFIDLAREAAKLAPADFAARR